MTPRNTTFLSMALVLGFAASAVAQSPMVKVKETHKGYFKMAKVTAADAQKTAQAQFPNGTVKSGEIEKEGGKLIYSFDIQQPAVTGIEEVNIDAMTGTVIKTEHESPAMEKTEKAKPKPKTPVKKPPAA